MFENLTKIYPNNINGGSLISSRTASSDSIAPTNQSITDNTGGRSTVKAPLNGPFTVLNFSKLQDPQDKKMYSEIYQAVGKEGKSDLETLLTTGRLLTKDSSDGSSTLQNLYKILTEPRAQGFDNKKILTQTVKILANPFVINQNFGKIPDFLTASIIANQDQNKLAGSMGLNTTLAPNFNQVRFTGPMATITPEDLNVTTSGTCVAASVEFNLADKRPAEFARYAAGLTSPQLEVKTKVKMSNIDTNPLRAMSLLDQFEVEHKEIDWDTIDVTLRPDRNSIVRARAESSYEQPNARSTIDTLTQSTFMQLGSANGYDSLTDKRKGDYIPDNKGLIEAEKTFVESVVDSTGRKVPVTYQIVDENAYLKGYTYDHDITMKNILDSLKIGSNVIVGITQIDDSNKIVGGHEVTIIGSRIDNNGELYFVCNDTDDDHVGPVEIRAKTLIPKIHHAGIPDKVLNIPPEEKYNFAILNEFQRLKQKVVI